MATLVTGAVLGVDTGTPALLEADHLLTALVRGLGLPAGGTAATHLIRSGEPHIAVSLTAPGSLVADEVLALLPAGAAVAFRDALGTVTELAPSASPDLSAGSAEAARAHGRTGRAVWYPGVERLTGTVTVGELLAVSAIDQVAVLLTDPPAPETLLDTRDHVRPEWRDGHLTLLTMPAPGGRLAPYEVPDPTPCCAAHH